MVSSTSRARTAKWWRPRALEAGRLSAGCRYTSRSRSRSASIAARSISVMPASDPEEDVQEAVRHRAVAPDGPCVAAPERREHEAAGVELEDGQSVGLSGGVREPLLCQQDTRVP